MRGMVRSFARLVERRGIPEDWILTLQHPVIAGWLAKGAIATELSLAVFLWWPRSRRLALWVGLVFHLTISLMTPVLFFTAEMLVIYLIFATPDRHARVLRYDPARSSLAPTIKALDWLGRYRLELASNTTLAVVDRDGTTLEGLQAAACVFGTIPLLFIAWPAVALAARMTRPRANDATAIPASGS